MKKFTNASNCSRAAKTSLAKQSGLAASEIKKGVHFQVLKAEFGDGFIWAALGTQTPVGIENLEETNPVADNESNDVVVEPCTFLDKEELSCNEEFSEVVTTSSTKTKTKAVGTCAGLKIQKDRETRNGITKPSIGGITIQYWNTYDKYYEETGFIPTPKAVQEYVLQAGLSITKATLACQLYAWRQFMGFKG